MSEKIFKRKIYERMLQWKQESDGQTALLIKGARRIGKSTIAEEFARREYDSYINIDFSIADAAVKELFSHISDLDYFFLRIQSLFNVSLHERKSVIIFDEVQLYPPARQAIKHLVKDRRYDYIETGSLLSIKKNVKGIVIPSEETRISMYPLDFEEFLWANGDTFTMDIIREHYQKVKPFGAKLNKEILRRFREYMCVGGMPQAVVAFAKTKDYERVDFAKREILELYRNDIKEQEEEKSEYVGNILDNIPSELARHDSVAKTNEFRLTHINKNARLREYKGPLRWLDEAMIVNVARNTTDPSPALTLNLDDERFKCYMMDTGLLINLSFGDGNFIDNDFYGAILTDRLHINEGMFVENVVAQCLRTNGHKIVFYVEYNERGELQTEIDFIIRKDRKIIPIEAKSGKEYTVKSLEKFKKKFSNKVGLQYVLHEGDIKRENEIVYFPYYIASIL